LTENVTSKITGDSRIAVFDRDLLTEMAVEITAKETPTGLLLSMTIEIPTPIRKSWKRRLA